MSKILAFIWLSFVVLGFISFIVHGLINNNPMAHITVGLIFICSVIWVTFVALKTLLGG